MLSILIPIYDYDAYALVLEIEQQALKNTLVYEIICIDDGSFSSLNANNQNINSLSNCKFIEAKKNRGRIGTRQFLANEAQYDWLLFLDCDVSLKSKDFITNYVNKIGKQYDAVFGGFAYKDENQDSTKSLRFTFGKQREEVPALKRNTLPYKTIISSNFLIKKNVFKTCFNDISENRYGLDYLFGSRLKQINAKVEHIDNEVYHLGIDTNDLFLEKTKKAVETLNYLNENNLIATHDISLLKAHRFLKTLFINKLFRNIVWRFKDSIEKQLKSNRPNLFLFDIYRLAYLCRLN